MKIKCYSVRLQSLVKISDKAYKATAFDGSTAIIPISQVFGKDWEVLKTDSYWIAAWILEKKSIQYSGKKVAWFNAETCKIEPNYKYEVEHHIPEKKTKSKSTIKKELKR
ncbi:hypothetical protein JSO62_09930 [Riemerella anatipestifer]|uniref:hypothetical protein n=1 Tax=Riemerella anatipestifer TaxID=34085 RepID=UPI0030C18DCC